MNIFLQRRPNYSIRELRALNRVRLYLRVYSRACITHRITSKLDLRLLTKRQAGVVRKSTLDWPSIVPKPSDWHIWNKAVTECFLDSSLALDESKMGRWICTHQSWPMLNTPPPPVALTWTRDPNWKVTLSIEGIAID